MDALEQMMKKNFGSFQKCLLLKIIFLLIYPITIATKNPIIFGSVICTIVFVSFKNTAGKIIAGNTADGTYPNIFFALSINLSGLINKIDPNLVK